MLIRTRGYHYYFSGYTEHELLVYETITEAGNKYYCTKREYGLKRNSPSARRLIKVLACTQQETTITLGPDGWAVQVWSETNSTKCLSNSTKKNESSTTSQKGAPLG